MATPDPFEAMAAFAGEQPPYQPTIWPGGETYARTPSTTGLNDGQPITRDYLLGQLLAEDKAFYRDGEGNIIGPQPNDIKIDEAARNMLVLMDQYGVNRLTDLPPDIVAQLPSKGLYEERSGGFWSSLGDFLTNPGVMMVLGAGYGAIAGGATGAAGGAAGGTGITPGVGGLSGTALDAGFYASEGLAAGGAGGAGGAVTGGALGAGALGSGLNSGMLATDTGFPVRGFEATDMGGGISSAGASSLLFPNSFAAENLGLQSGISRPTTGGSGTLGSGNTGLAEYLEKLKKLGLFPGGSNSTLMNLLNIGSGIYGLSEARGLRRAGERAAAAADPFGPYRGQYAQKLSALEANPESITSLPGYKAGEQAIMRSMASQGYLGSGNMMTALQNYGGKIYDTEARRLAELAGAGIAPNPGLALQGEIAGTTLASQALRSLGYGIRGFF